MTETLGLMGQKPAFGHGKLSFSLVCRLEVSRWFSDLGALVLRGHQEVTLHDTKIGSCSPVAYYSI